MTAALRQAGGAIVEVESIENDSGLVLVGGPSSADRSTTALAVYRGNHPVTNR